MHRLSCLIYTSENRQRWFNNLLSRCRKNMLVLWDTNLRSRRLEVGLEEQWAVRYSGAIHSIKTSENFVSKLIGSIRLEKFRKNWSTFWGGLLFPVGPVGIFVEWIAPGVSQSIKIGIDLSIDISIKIGKSNLIDIDCIDQSVEVDDTLVSFIDLSWFLPIPSIYFGRYISSSKNENWLHASSKFVSLRSKRFLARFV